MSISFSSKGDWDDTTKSLNRLNHLHVSAILTKYGQQGVRALAAATPVDEGETAHGWYFRIIQRKGYYSIRWYNSHIVDGVPIAVIIQYGHATKNGGYVEGVDYINPAIQPIFDQIANEVWKEVTK